MVREGSETHLTTIRGFAANYRGQGSTLPLARGGSFTQQRSRTRVSCFSHSAAQLGNIYSEFLPAAKPVRSICSLGILEGAVRSHHLDYYQKTKTISTDGPLCGFYTLFRIWPKLMPWYLNGSFIKQQKLQKMTNIWNP